MVSTPQERKRLIQGVIVVGAGLAVPQVLAYAASVIAARLLVPAEFGAFGAMQGITQIGTPIEIVKSFGGRDKYLEAVQKLETALYATSA